MKKKLILSVLSINLATSTVMAGTMGIITQEQDLRWVATLSAGPVWGDEGKTQTFYLTPEIQKTYTANNSSQAMFNGEIFAGLQKSFSQTIQAQLGIALAATSNAKFSGNIWDDADPRFNNFTYKYKLQHRYVGVKGKLLANAGYWVTPWISASGGIGFNKAHSFQDSPTIPEAITNPDFTNNSKNTFSYTLGAGVQKALDSNWQLGIGYEFADWGKSNLGRAAGQTVNTGISLNNFYTNGVLVNITYVS